MSYKDYLARIAQYMEDQKNGPRPANQASGSGAGSNAQPSYRAVPFPPGPFASPPHQSFIASTFNSLSSAQQQAYIQYMQNRAMLQAQQNAAARMAGMGTMIGGPSIGGGLGPAFAGPPIIPLGVGQCKKCGMAYKGDHECPIASRTDLDAVRTIQALAAEGLSPEEIAGDMKLTLGWRKWSTGSELGGAGDGSISRWPLDRPVMAVCVNTHCLIPNESGKTRRDACETSTRPFCRIHAVKTRELNNVAGYSGLTGAVAMWGDVIELEKGFLSTRAYPLAFESEAWARAYRVGVLRPVDEPALIAIPNKIAKSDEP